MTDDAEAVRVPHVRVVRGTPDDVELAALVAGLVAATSSDDDDADLTDDAEAAPAWADRGRTLPGAAATWRTGADAWRTSLR